MPFGDDADTGQRDARLAFIGATAWLDAVAIVAWPRTQPTQRGLKPTRKWVNAYMPEWYGQGRSLYVGLRCALLHNYSTQGFALSHGDRARHHKEVELESGERRILVNIESLVDEFEAAWHRFYATCESDRRLRNLVVANGTGLLSGVTEASEPASSTP
jgi:hypothetical protein